MNAIHGGVCRQCLKPRPSVSMVTCGRSECQQQEYRDNLARNAPKRRARRTPRRAK